MRLLLDDGSALLWDDGQSLLWRDSYTAPLCASISRGADSIGGI